MNLWLGFVVLVLYYLVIVAVLPMLLKKHTRLPKEWVRKTQHIGFAASIFFYLYLFDPWQDSVIAALMFMTLAFLFLSIYEATPYYKKTLVDREGRGELKQSLILVTVTYILLIVIFTVIFDACRGTVVIAVLSWGVGDAMAAVIGKRFGKKKVEVGTIKTKKTFVGSHAMTLSVFVIVFALSMVYFDFPFYIALLLAVIVAPIASTIELFTRDGFDTVTIPLGVASLVYFLCALFNYLGVGG